MVKHFEWDEKNIDKNWKKHKVKPGECEEIFLNDLLLIAEVDKSKILFRENRHIAYGVSNSGRLLFIVFTVLYKKVRIISARDMSKKERKYYYEETKKLD